MMSESKQESKQSKYAVLNFNCYPSGSVVSEFKKYIDPKMTNFKEFYIRSIVYGNQDDDELQTAKSYSLYTDLTDSSICIFSSASAHVDHPNKYFDLKKKCPASYNFTVIDNSTETKATTNQGILSLLIEYIG